MKRCIPIQEISQIEIECISHNIKTNYFKFRVSFNGSLKQEFNLTYETLKIIRDEAKEIVDKIRVQYEKET